jgi:hypothetical protein
MSKTIAPVSSATSTVSSGTGFWSRLLTNFAKARSLQAEREVARYLANRPDRYLHDIGMSDDEIAEMRRKFGN